MKKTLLFIIGILLLTGCSFNPNKNNISIKLKGNPTTGYNWTYKIANIIIIKDKTINNNYKEDSNKDNALGVGGTYTYKFKAIKKGITNIVFIYSSTSDIQYRITYKIKVDNNKNISINIK